MSGVLIVGMVRDITPDEAAQMKAQMSDLGVEAIFISGVTALAVVPK